MKRTEKGRRVNFHLEFGVLTKTGFFAEREGVRYEGKTLDEVIDAAVEELREDLHLEIDGWQ